MNPIKPALAGLALLLMSTPAWGQSAQAVAAMEVTDQELAYIEEVYSPVLNSQLDAAIAQLSQVATSLHSAFPVSLHDDIDAAINESFEASRPEIAEHLKLMLAQNMTLAELEGETPTPARQEEIDQRMYEAGHRFGERMASRAIRHLCDVIGDRAPTECRVVLQRLNELDGQTGV